MTKRWHLIHRSFAKAQDDNRASYKINLSLFILLMGICFFLLTGCQNQEESTLNSFLGKWVSQGLFLEEGITEKSLTAQEKLGLKYVNSYFKEGAEIEFLENGVLKITDIGEAKYEITKDNRLKIMNDIAGIIVDFEIDEDIALIRTNKMYIKLIKDYSERETTHARTV